MTFKTRPIVTVALSQHRPEVVRNAAGLMAAHAAIFLEEPPSPELDGMLSGDLAVDAYLQGIDTEFPEFSRRMAVELKRLAANGKQIHAVEPFLEHLVAIHEFFADGHSPAGLPPDTDRRRVYLAERDATAALLTFYEAAADGSFQETIDAVKAFARQDARRFVLRDKLRAAALARHIKNVSSAYVEAGQMHYALWRYLRTALGPGFDVRLRFLTDAARPPAVRNGHLYGPGDILTLLHIFHPGFRDLREDLLAARSLIYHKLITKTEMSASGTDSPHADEEVAVLARLNRLSLADCRRLYPLVRGTDTSRAVEIVDRYLDLG